MSLSNERPPWDLLPDVPLFNLFKYLNVFHMKQIRLINKRWNEVVKAQFEKNTQLVIENCIIDLNCPPWSFLKNSNLHFKNIKLVGKNVGNFFSRQFWLDVGEHTENLIFDVFMGFHNNFDRTFFLVSFPKLKTVSLDLSAFEWIDVPETVETIHLESIPKYLRLREFETFKKIMEKKHLKEILTDDVEEILFPDHMANLTEAELGIVRLITDIFDGEYKHYHLFNILQTKNLSFSHIRGIKLKNHHEQYLAQLENLENLYLNVKPNGCFFVHQYVKLEKVKFVHLKAENWLYFELDLNANDESDTEIFYINFNELDHAEEQYSEEDELSDEGNVSIQTEYEATDLDDTHDLLKITIKSEVNDDDDDADDSFDEDEDVQGYCQICIDNLKTSCPNIVEWQFRNLLSNYESFIEGPAANSITKFSLKGHEYYLKHFIFNFSNLEELTFHYKHSFLHKFELSDANFVYMPKLKKISFKLREMSTENLEEILIKCPSVEVAEFKKLTIEQVVLIEENWPDLKELYFDFHHIEIKNLIRALKGKFTSLRVMSMIRQSFAAYETGNEDYVGLFDKIPTLRIAYALDYKEYCQLKYFKD